MHATESPECLLTRTALPLIMRGIIIAGFQHLGKRAIFAKADESLLTTYAVFSAIEGFIFILIFRGLRIVSATVSQVYSKEKTPIENVPFNPTEMGLVYRQGVMFGCVLMIPTALLCASTPLIFQWTQQSDDVLKNCVSYFSWGFLSYFVDMLYRSRARVDIGMSNSMPVLIGDISESLLDVTLTYLFVNGKCGFPKMGVTGGAVAYTLASAITALGYNLRSYWHPDFERYQFYRFSLNELKETLLSSEFKKMVVGGFHIAFKYSILYITLMLTTFLCGLSGSGALAGLQAAGAYGYIVTLPIGGLSEAASVVIGRLFKNNGDQAKKIGNSIIAISCAFSCFSAAMLFTFINPIASIFVDQVLHEKDFQIVKQFLRVQAVMEIVNSVGNTSSSALVGFLETQYPFLLSVIFIFALNSLLALTTYFGFQHDATSMYAIQMVGLLFNAVGVLMRWKNQKNQNQSVVIDVPAIIYRAKSTLFCESPRRYSVEIETSLPEPTSI